MTEKSVFCKNCGGEYILSELGVYNDDETGALRYFCAWCGEREFLTADEVDEDGVFEEMEKKLENGPARYFPYPEKSKIIRMPTSEFSIKHHQEEYKKYKKKSDQENKERILAEDV